MPKRSQLFSHLPSLLNHPPLLLPSPFSLTQLTPSLTHILCSHGTGLFIPLFHNSGSLKVSSVEKSLPTFSHMNNPYSSFKVRVLCHFYNTFPSSPKKCYTLSSICFHETQFLPLFLYPLILCLYVMVSPTECLK